MVTPLLAWLRRLVVVLVLLSAVFVVARALSFLDAGGPSPGGSAPVGGPGLGANVTTFGILATVVLIPVALVVVYRVLNSGLLDDF